MQIGEGVVWLKQSTRDWFDIFSKVVIGLGYQQSNAGRTMFINHSNGKIVMLIVYVDDMVVTGNDLEAILNFKCYLSKEFETRTWQNCKTCLGLKSPDLIRVSSFSRENM